MTGYTVNGGFAQYVLAGGLSLCPEGDFEVLLERDRRVLRAHLGADVRAGLNTLRRAISTVLSS